LTTKPKLIAFWLHNTHESINTGVRYLLMSTIYVILLFSRPVAV